MLIEISTCYWATTDSVMETSKPNDIVIDTTQMENIPLLRYNSQRLRVKYSLLWTQRHFSPKFFLLFSLSVSMVSWLCFGQSIEMQLIVQLFDSSEMSRSATWNLLLDALVSSCHRICQNNFIVDHFVNIFARGNSLLGFISVSWYCSDSFDGFGWNKYSLRQNSKQLWNYGTENECFHSQENEKWIYFCWYISTSEILHHNILKTIVFG